MHPRYCRNNRTHLAQSHSAMVSHLFLLSLPSALLHSPKVRLIKQDLALPQGNPGLNPMQIVFAQSMAKTQVYSMQYIQQQ